MKYWFILYEVAFAVVGRGIQQNHFNTISNIHPVDWLIQKRKEAESVITIIWFTEIELPENISPIDLNVLDYK